MKLKMILYIYTPKCLTLWKKIKNDTVIIRLSFQLLLFQIRITSTAIGAQDEQTGTEQRVSNKNRLMSVIFYVWIGGYLNVSNVRILHLYTKYCTYKC